jgi:hypothetical protein
MCDLAHAQETDQNAVIALDADQPSDPAWSRNLGETEANTEPSQGTCQLPFPPIHEPFSPPYMFILPPSGRYGCCACVVPSTAWHSILPGLLPYHTPFPL